MLIEVDADDDLTPFIETANVLVTKICGVNDGNGVPYYTDSVLELIERWLSAHFYAVYRPRAEVEGVDNVIEHIETKLDIGFNVTRYGQQAMRIDYNGFLAAVNNAANKIAANLPGGNRRTAFLYLGKTPPYPD